MGKMGCFLLETSIGTILLVPYANPFSAIQFQEFTSYKIKIGIRTTKWLVVFVFGFSMLIDICIPLVILNMDELLVCLHTGD